MCGKDIPIPSPQSIILYSSLFYCISYGLVRANPDHSNILQTAVGSLRGSKELVSPQAPHLLPFLASRFLRPGAPATEPKTRNPRPKTLNPEAMCSHPKPLQTQNLKK